MQTTEAYRALPADVSAFVDRQYRDAYALIDACRHPRTGLYADAYMTMGANPESRCSIAATGVGLIALCIADLEGWDDEAPAKAMTTLRAATGGVDGCRPAREARTGFFAHFVDMETGANLNSEYSTIDTSLLAAGAMMARNHFQARDNEIARLADALLHSIDWSVIVADARRGSIHMIVRDGRGAAPTQPFNEYALTAYVAALARPDDGEIRELWDNVYAEHRLNELPQAVYRDVPVLTDADRGQRFLSSFVHQFPFYLVGNYARSSAYREWLERACLADRLKWKEANDLPSYVWGYGAGANDGWMPTYHADRIGSAPGGVASAYIVAGFLPVYPAGVFDLYALYRLHFPYPHYENAADPQDESRFRAAYRYGLHRYAWRRMALPDRWYPEKVTVIDWSSMLYGLAAFKRGMALFADRLPVVPTLAARFDEQAG